MNEPEFNAESLIRLKELLAVPVSVVLTTHFKPDGDALGSVLALYHVLKKQGHKVTVIVPSEIPGYLKWMKGSDEVIDFTAEKEKTIAAFSTTDLLFCLDFNDPARTESMTPLINNCKAIKILIDHHMDPVDFADLTFSIIPYGSTCEILYCLLVDLSMNQFIDRDIAECIYTGIMTDTGSFRFNSVTPVTHRVVSDLLERGARNYYVHEKIYDTNSESRLRFLGHCLLNCMTVLTEFNTVYFRIDTNALTDFHHQPGDMEGIVNYGLSIEGIKMSALFAEREGIVKISFRSKDDFSVQALATNYFQGGGHKNAAGGKSFDSLDDTISRFKNLLPEFRHELS